MKKQRVLSVYYTHWLRDLTTCYSATKFIQEKIYIKGTDMEGHKSIITW